VGEPMKMRTEYLVPVDQQVLGRDGSASGVERAFPRKTGPRTLPIIRPAAAEAAREEVVA